MHKVPSTGDLFSMRKVSSNDNLLSMSDNRRPTVVAKASIVASTATILSAASSIVSSSNALVAPHPEAATVVSAVASLLGGTASLLAATIERHDPDEESESEPDQESEVSMISFKDLDVDSEASLHEWKEAGISRPIRTTVRTSRTCDEDGIVFINGVPLKEYMERSDIKRIDLKIK